MVSGTFIFQLAQSVPVAPVVKAVEPANEDTVRIVPGLLVSPHLLGLLFTGQLKF